MENTKYDVFISYSSVDQKIAEGVCAYLEQHGVRCFVAYRDIPRSKVWAGVIVEALEQSHMMLVLFSKHFNQSEQVEREIELAAEQKMPILTFRLSGDAFSGAKKYYLQNLNWIDAFPNPERYFESLRKNVFSLLGKDENVVVHNAKNDEPVIKKEQPIVEKKPSVSIFNMKRWLWGIIASIVVVFIAVFSINGHDDTSLYVSTSPAGAAVYVDGEKVGISPIEGKRYARGIHTVEIKLDGYNSISEKLEFSEKPVVLSKTLEKILLKDTILFINGYGMPYLARVPLQEIVPKDTLTRLYVSTSPAGAAVYIDGEKVGTSPIEGEKYARGFHTVEIKLDGYNSVSEKLDFSEKSVVLSKTLEKIVPKDTLTRLYLSTTPSGAAVYVDGKKVGTSPINGEKHARGIHTVEIKLAGYNSVSEKLDFSEKSVVLSKTLEKIVPKDTLTQLYVSTSPAGAAVYVDGKKVGTSPINGEKYARGIHTVEIKLAGYNSVIEKLNFVEKSVVLSKTLEKIVSKDAFTQLYVSTLPAGAAVYVDGEKVGTTPINSEKYACGRHTVEIKLDGYNSIIEKLDFSEEPIVLSKTLEKIVSKDTLTQLYVSTSPAGAAVYVDGKKVGVTPIKGTKYSRCIHTVEIKLDGYNSIIEKLDFSEKLVVINKVLEKKTIIGNLNGHEWVDLGLSVKWATCNVGANSPEEYGDYFAWGETMPKDKYTEKNSKMIGNNIGDISGNYEYDAATANWGAGWRMPTKKELEELKKQCTWKWTEQDGKKGCKVTSNKNGNSIFLPAAGYRYGASLEYANNYGYCWSSTIYGGEACHAYGLYFYGSNHNLHRIDIYRGRSVRPVTK